MLLSFPVARTSAFVAASFWMLASADAQELSYRWKPGQKFSYDMKIVVQGGDETITYQGIVHYTVNDANANQAKVTYRGGLRESKKVKQQRGPRFGPRGFGPPSIPSPFSRPTFAGKTQTTNKLTLTTRGQTLAMQGDSQLPYLLGNVSLLPFEPLPDGEKKQWGLDSGVSITEESNNNRNRFGPFGPFGPRGPFGGDDDKNVQAAGEESNFTILRQEGDLVVAKKTYRLYTPATEDNAAFEMVGQGTWTFDRKENIPHAYDMKFSLKVTKANTTSTIPITVKYDRISAEKLAEMEAAAKKKAEELAKAAAEKKAMAEAPLTDDEKRQALGALASNDAAKIRTTLGKLAEKSLADPDPEIAAAIERHLTSSDRRLAGEAHKAMAKWSPNYAKQAKLKKDYQGPSPVKSTGLIVESITPLFVGQIVQAQRPRRGSFWRPARVKKLLPDGQVELAFLTWGKENSRDVVVVNRRMIQLAPPELQQPERPAGTPAKMETATRTWTDSTGKFKVDAALVNVSDGKVNLRRSDGRTMSIPLERLSDADQAHVKELQQPAAENPFQLN